MSNPQFQRQLTRDVNRAARRGIRRNQRSARGRSTRRSRHGSQGIFAWLGVVILGILAAAVISWWQHEDELRDYTDGQSAEVVSIVDGDTLVVDIDGTQERVRLLNIDTPESVHPHQPVECLGPESTQRMQELVSPGEELRLEFDEDLRDRYERLLAAVYVEDLFINEQMAREGFGEPAYYAPNDRFLSQIEDAWAEAEAAGEGLFADGLHCEPGQPVG
ncbi:thermonuclease family protein [Nesterenkonia massiliensis]|uniref:Thermonuclease family protein n=1 Tax=Nesterenkonia massiliensis TaxID=1232429 RepID=A0ABT2HU56_9MICC|nr:thermonuclease family protein [Nesterenkonia massiliensis]MCT1608045.1 thermonuclease family protein [Nesterenkonia massiliensis]